jgi:hypothetical protein
MRELVVASLLWVFFVPKVEAQVGAPWLIIPVTTSTDEPWTEPTAQAFRQELWDRGIEVWSLERAASRFEDKGSTPAVRLSDVEFQDWEAGSQAAIAPLASGDYAEALDLLDEVQELSRTAPEALNRDPARAQKVLDTCLYMVRALLETGSESLANRLAQECRQLVLVGEPTPRMHPPNVLQSLARVDAARSQQTGEIHVESQPSNCPVRVNGVLLGNTPLELGELFVGRYRVQVECEPGQRSRVHRASVGFVRTDVFVDVGFDAAVETRPLLYLHDAESSSEATDRIANAVQVGEVVPSGALLLMRQTSPGIAELELLRGTPAERQGLARVRTGREGPTPGDVALATRALIDAECVDFTGTAPRVLPCREGADVLAERPVVDDGRPARRTPRGQFIAGVTLASIGSAALITGYALLIPRKSVAEDWISQVDAPAVDSASTQQQWLDMQGAIIVTGSIGAGALVAAMPLALPKYVKTPWWAWLSGGFGVGLAAFSVAYGVTAEAEPSVGCNGGVDTAAVRTCVTRGEQVSLAFLTGVTSAPLLTVPLVYLLRRSDKEVTPSVEVGRAGGYLSVRGHF